MSLAVIVLALLGNRLASTSEAHPRMVIGSGDAKVKWLAECCVRRRNGRKRLSGVAHSL